MVKKKKHGFLIFCLVLLFITIVFGVVFRIQIPDCGVSKLSNIKDVQERSIRLDYAWGKGTEEGLDSNFGTDGSRYGVASAEIIAVVSPTGNIIQTDSTMGQEFTVKKIIRGDNFISIGQTAYVYVYFGFRAVDGEIRFLNTLNIMYPGNDYLIFMDQSPLNDYQQKTAYVLKSDWFGYMKTEGRDTLTLKENYMDYNFSDLEDYEFFSTSDVVTKFLNAARDELRSQYLKKEIL